MKNTLVPNGTIGREDFALFSIVDSPKEIRFLINEHYRVFGGVRPTNRAKKQGKASGKK
jgi:hypothetical protein